ncbi:hypothetical protein [Halalkalibacter krulwichiae]|uniref:Uncharacterized protein n=1 Tax=Halalkalibacter krulwichiae TaxID=199441 RepID=A0A1X9MF94_9BACI|nr:hypothetical protein [Halalkalibacter krulwichiae]ARK32108.1 hypothetical protein BkAM31D_20940 [Halalkalibacter krulwichiae]
MKKELENLIIEFEMKLKRPLREIEVKVLEFLIKTEPENSSESDPLQYLQ